MSRWPDLDTLIRGTSDGDDVAAEALVRWLKPRLEAQARVRGLSPEDAEEVAQDTLLAVLTQLRDQRFEARSQLTSWVWAIFDRRAIDHYRRHRRHRAGKDSIQDLPHGDIPLESLVPQEEAATTLLVRAALEELTPKHRLVLLLNCTEGLPAREIATMLRVHVKTAEALVTAARKAFRLHVTREQESPRVRRLRS